jgi:hypothetical protein
MVDLELFIELDANRGRLEIDIREGLPPKESLAAGVI